MADTNRFVEIETAVHKAFDIFYREFWPEAHPKTSWKEQVPKILLKFVTSIADINKTLKAGDLKRRTDIDNQVLSLLALKVVLDFETLQDLYLMPPSGYPFETWVCCAGPCKSGYDRRHQNIQTVKRLRSLGGIKDDIPEDYYDKYEEEWREIWEKERVERGEKFKKSKVYKERTDNHTPLALVPVRHLDVTVKNAIIEKEPGLKPFIDNLFLCCYHFKKVTSREKNEFSQRKYSSYTVGDLNKNIAEGEVRLASSYFFKNRKHLSKLLMLLNKGFDIDTTLRKKSFKNEECVLTIVNRLKKMENNFSHQHHQHHQHHRGDFNNGYYPPSSHQQYEGRSQGAQDYAGAPQAE